MSPARRLLVLLAAALAGAAAALTASTLIVLRGPAGPGELEVRLVPSLNASTDVALPPLGRVRAATHDAPVRFEAEVQRLNVRELQALTAEARPDEVALRQVRTDLGPLLKRVLAVELTVAFLAGGAAAALLPRRRLAMVGAGALGGLVAVGGLLGLAWRQFEPEAFAQPTFEGALEQAPQIIGTVQRHVRDFEDVRDRMQALTLHVGDLYRASQQTPTEQLGDTAILHISDIHSNPLGLELALQLADSFRVDAILDTGDLTSFGLPVEGRIGELLDGLERPYLLVPGNHDSAANRQTLAELAQVTLLDSEVLRIGSVDILGVADPTFTATNEVSTEDANEVKEATAPQVMLLARRHRPDLLAVHDRRQAANALGFVPVIVAGHAHERHQERHGRSVLLEVGSSGAAGLEAFLVEEPRSYESQILRFEDGRLVAVDYLSLTGVQGEFRLDRRLFEPDTPPTLLARDGRPEGRPSVIPPDDRRGISVPGAPR